MKELLLELRVFAVIELDRGLKDLRRIGGLLRAESVKESWGDLKQR